VVANVGTPAQVQAGEIPRASLQASRGLQNGGAKEVQHETEKRNSSSVLSKRGRCSEQHFPPEECRKRAVVAQSLLVFPAGR